MKTITATMTGMRITTRYAPSRNLTETTTARTTAVRTPPKALRTARQRQPDSWELIQWRTMPLCESVKQTNTPTA